MTKNALKKLDENRSLRFDDKVTGGASGRKIL